MIKASFDFYRQNIFSANVSRISIQAKQNVFSKTGLDKSTIEKPRKKTKMIEMQEEHYHDNSAGKIDNRNVIMH